MAEYGNQGVDADTSCYQHQACDILSRDREDWGRVCERAAYADGERRVEDGVGGAVEVFRWRVGGILYGEFDIGWWIVAGFGDGGGGGRGYGEAACFGDGGDEGVEPLAGEELEIWLDAEDGFCK